MSEEFKQLDIPKACIDPKVSYEKLTPGEKIIRNLYIKWQKRTRLKRKANIWERLAKAVKINLEVE